MSKKHWHDSADQVAGRSLSYFPFAPAGAHESRSRGPNAQSLFLSVTVQTKTGQVFPARVLPTVFVPIYGRIPKKTFSVSQRTDQWRVQQVDSVVEPPKSMLEPGRQKNWEFPVMCDLYPRSEERGCTARLIKHVITHQGHYREARSSLPCSIRQSP